jgi:2-polyprenyl-6-methoxyphenol hydroxylase-like FAD-dependent oxidoreductase
MPAIAHRPSTALVIGGSIAGLLAARVLSELYPEVIVFERDALDSPAPRKGVPQGRHAHALLAGGQQALEELFPGLVEELRRQGAPRGQGRFFSDGGYFHPLGKALQGLFVSRGCLEAEVRLRVRARPNVRLVTHADVRGMVMNETRTRVRGLRFARVSGHGEETLEGDLLVDASGSGSRTPDWLEALDFPRPRLERVDVRMGYATRLYRRRPGDLGGDLLVSIPATRGNRRASGMLAQEGARWIVTIAGYFGDDPPTDPLGFLEFARTLPAPDVYDFLRTATPLDDPVAFRFPANRRYRYDALARLPENLVVLGDALCSFTPIYGQGMTVAALEALALRACLKAHPAHLGRAFFKKAKRAVDIAWTISAGRDRRLSDAGDPSLRGRFLGWYLNKLQVAARVDPVVSLAFRRVANLLDAPPHLLRPSVLARVLWGNLRWACRTRRGDKATPQQPARSAAADGIS